LGGAYKTAIQPEQVLQNQVMKQMTFTYERSSLNSIFKMLEMFKEFDLYYLNLPEFISRSSSMAN